MFTTTKIQDFALVINPASICFCDNSWKGFVYNQILSEMLYFTPFSSQLLTPFKFCVLEYRYSETEVINDENSFP